jgi:hypothetical protein
MITGKALKASKSEKAHIRIKSATSTKQFAVNSLTHGHQTINGLLQVNALCLGSEQLKMAKPRHADFSRARLRSFSRAYRPDSVIAVAYGDNFFELPELCGFT